MILPGFDSLRKRLRKRIRKRPKRKTRKQKDQFQLTMIEGLLRWINSIRNIPDITTQEIQECLQMMRRAAEGIKKKEYKELKQKVIEYSENEYKLYGKVIHEERVEILEGAFELMEDIREAKSPNYIRTKERD